MMIIFIIIKYFGNIIQINHNNNLGRISSDLPYNQ